MSSTFTAPMRINTRQTTSNDGTISPDNTGAAILSQEVTLTATGDTNTAIIYLPAGSFIQFAKFYATDVGTTARALTLDGVAIGTVDVTGADNWSTFTDPALVSNTGPATSALVIGAGASDSAGVFSIVYTARNANGTITPYGSGLTNS